MRNTKGGRLSGDWVQFSRSAQFSSVQSLSRVQLFATPWTAARQASQLVMEGWPTVGLHHQILESTQPKSIESMMPSNHLIFCHPLLLPSPIFPSIRVFFQWVSSSHQVAKVLEFQLQPQSYQWIFRTDFLQDWLVWSPCSPRDSQESSPTPQFKSINSSVLSFMVQLSHLYMTTGKTIALTRQTFVGKVMSLLFNMLSGLVIAFLSRSKHLFISWLQSPSAEILQPKK